MFGADRRKAGFGANADPGNVCGARNAQLKQGFFDLSFGETMSAHARSRADEIFCFGISINKDELLIHAMSIRRWDAGYSAEFANLRPFLALRFADFGRFVLSDSKKCPLFHN